MSRKHFRALASALAGIKPAPHAGIPALTAWQIVCQAIADACATCNDRFNRAQFLNTCKHTDA